MVLSETRTQRNSQNATETVLEGEEMIKHVFLLLIIEVLFHLEENMFHNLPITHHFHALVRRPQTPVWFFQSFFLSSSFPSSN
jgi:hypothetical protein